jgi:GTPase
MITDEMIGETRLEGLDEKTKVLTIGFYKSGKEKDLTNEHLSELKALCDTFGIDVIHSMPTLLKKVDSSIYVGKGKLQELKEIVEEKKITVVVFDEEIAPHQQRNIEKELKCIVIDRTELILAVFGKRAQTREAKIQISLASFKYQLPRLKKLWTHLGRQKVGGGGSGGYLKGEGEKQIEIDRRILRRKISKLHKDLDHIKNQRHLQRKQRQKKAIPTFAIVGYTNAGKSTLLKLLTDADVFVEDKLFATLDTTTRKFTLPNKQEILLVDTVGFIRKIPHNLVAAFKSTLEEAAYCDILIHLIDISNPDVEEMIEATFSVLKELQADDKPMITVFNKIDKCDQEEKKLANKLKFSFQKPIFFSCIEKQGVDELVSEMEKKLSQLRRKVELKIPQSHYSLVSELIKKGRVISCEYVDNDILLTIEIPSNLEYKIKDFIL